MQGAIAEPAQQRDYDTHQPPPPPVETSFASRSEPWSPPPEPSYRDDAGMDARGGAEDARDRAPYVAVADAAAPAREPASPAREPAGGSEPGPASSDEHQVG